MTRVFFAFFLIRHIYRHFPPIPVVVPSKAWVYGRSLTGIVGSNPA
jgi:hypothetical protein